MHPRKVGISLLEAFILKFANDTKGLQKIATNEVWNKMQQGYDLLSQCTVEWRQAFNVAKYKVHNACRPAQSPI
jgi:hypothetical protein